MLHDLLELQSATNGGLGGCYLHDVFTDYNLSRLPQPEESYFADELMVLSSDLSFVDSMEESDLLKQNSMNKLKQFKDNVWSEMGNAEQLFLKEQDVLCTPRAYCSMIRGSSKFRNPTRSLELFDQLCNSKHGSQSIDLATYNSLLRSLHYLPMIQNNKENLWDYVLKVVNIMNQSNQSVNVDTYTNILYTLSENAYFFTKQIIIDTKPGDSLKLAPDYIPLAMGLMNEMKTNNLIPQLGTYANLFWLIFNTFKIKPKDDSSAVKTDDKMDVNYYYAYSLDLYMNEIFNIVEYDLKDSLGSRFDTWGQDYNRFFPIFMKLSWFYTNYELALRLNNFLFESQNRSFFLERSFDYNKYVEYFCLLMFRVGNKEVRSHEFIFECLKNPIKFYLIEIISNSMLLNRFIFSFSRFCQLLSSSSNANTTDVDDDLISLKRELYECACYVVHTMCDGFIRSKDLFIVFIEILSKFASFNLVEAFDLYTKLLHNVTTSSEQNIWTEISKYSTFTECLMSLTIPLIDEISRDKSKLDSDIIDRIKNGLEYAHKIGHVSWTFTPKVLLLVWTHDDLISKYEFHQRCKYIIHI